MRFRKQISALFRRWQRWRHQRVIAWEDRYIIQYQKQIDDAQAGIQAASRRREKSRRQL